MNNFNLSVQVRLATRKADKAGGGIGTGYGNVKIFKHTFLQYLKLSLYSVKEMAHKVAPLLLQALSSVFTKLWVGSFSMLQDVTLNVEETPFHVIR